ncbi:MAG: KR domain-containing protein, partial [Planctomycetota bacterium]
MPRLPQFYGGALILGDNPVATALADRLRTHDVDVKTLSIAGGPANSGGGGDLDAELDRIWASAWTPHLFVTTPHDPAAAWFSTDVDGCKKRLPFGLHAVYRVAQRWMTHAVDQNRMSEASLMSLICGGGDFGFQDASPLHRTSAESGGIAGLTKAMSIEAWMRGYRETPMRVIDSPPGTPPRAIIEGMFREWATPSHDLEATVYEPANRTHELANGMENQSALARRVPMAMHRPLTNRPQAKSRPPENRPLAKSQVDNVPLTPGGVWIVAGGGRGITAFVAMELAKRYDLKLRMLGMAPKPEIDSQTHDHAVSDLPGLRRLKFAQWTKAGENPVRRWRHFEKALEIHRTLLECQRANIDAKYCSVDVSDVAAVADACEQIRRQNGAIRGVIQGAGSGQDARFDRKRVDKVRQCLSAKIDGTAALAAA